MEATEFLVVGAGVSGLSLAGALRGQDYLILEAEAEPGGYCRTVKQDGFVWDYSGHFFHFKHPEIERELVARMGEARVRVVEKRSKILFPGADDAGRYLDFPFQKNIHQLPKAAFIDCLVDLYFRDDKAPENFREMLYAKFGKSIAELFLVPYNEKLYATDLRALDVDAMGRFFPHAKIEDVLRNFKNPDAGSYNQTFTYPEGGAEQYIRALLTDVDASKLRLHERVVAIDRTRRIATTTRGEIRYGCLVSSVPFPQLLSMAGVAWDPAVFSWNKVFVANLGFDRKGPGDMHWLYVPQRDLCFYRVGFYDNILDGPRMSLYVEVGLAADAHVDEGRLRAQIVLDLARAGIVTDQQLVASHTVVLDPAYVHIRQDALAEVTKQNTQQAADRVFSIGRYGSWTYCSIEDNIVEARALAKVLQMGVAG